MARCQLAVQGQVQKAGRESALGSHCEEARPTLSPAVRDSQLWQRGSAEAATGELRASLVQVAALTINLREAGIAERDDKRLVLSSDSPYQLRLTGLDDGQSVEVEGSRWQVRNGELVLSMPAGDRQVVFP